MKKSLLLGSALLIGVGAFAQANRRATGSKIPLNKKVKAIETEITPSSQSTQKVLKPVAENNVMVNSFTFADSYLNGYGMASEDQVVLSYNADLNTVAFVNRLGSGFPTNTVFAPYLPAGASLNSHKSGYQQLTFTNDNGTTWDTTVVYSGRTRKAVRGRYPSGVIVNAAGNTDLNNAYFVATGPGTDSAAGTGWVGSYAVSATMQAALDNNVLANNDQKVLFVGDSSTSAGRRTYFPTMCATTNGSKYFTMMYKYDGTNVYNAALLTGTLNTGTGKFDWTQDSTTFSNGWHAAANGDFDFGQPKIAFGPDGLTGYVVISGVSATATGDAAKHYAPNVWKTLDGGTTWNKVNDNYDWRASHPEILGNLITNQDDNDWDGSGWLKRYPMFVDKWGGEIVVDNAGKLHYVTAVSAGASSHPDSLGYGYTHGGFSYVQYDMLDKPWVWDFTTDGNGTWDAKFISFLNTRLIADDETVASNFKWTSDGTASLDYTNRIKASRSNDGTKVFMTWTDSDSTQVDLNTPPLPAQPYNTYISNKTPSIFYKGLDAATGALTPTYEAVYFDAVEDAFYLYQTSEIAMVNGAGYSIPTMYISSATGTKNLSQAVNHNYITDLQIDNTAYTETYTNNTAPCIVCTQDIGLRNAENSVITGVSQNFPNPFNGSTSFTVNLNKSEVITVNVTNAVGQVVATKVVKGTAGINDISLDAANLESGIYFYSVVAGNAKVTRKMSVVK